jgi:uncharacterized protein YtpQ (UPF0354 family)
MGWFDFLGRKVSPEQFAKRFGAVLQREGPDLRPVYEPDEFRFKLGPSSYVNLHNAYHAYVHAARRDRSGVLVRFVQAFLSEPEIPASFAEAHARLLPIVRASVYIDYIRRHARLDPGTVRELAYRQLDDELVLLLAFDSERNISILTSSTLEDWGVSFDVVLDAALANLRDRTVAPLVPSEIRSDLLLGDWNDEYDSSRLLLPDVAHRAFATGAPVVMVPTRETFLVAPRESPEAQLAMVALAAKLMASSSRQCSPMMYHYPDGQLVVYEPGDAATRHAWTQLRQASLDADYANQKVQLDQLHEAQGQDIFVASYVLFDEGGTRSSICSWTEGVTAGLLPYTDVVALVRLTESQPARIQKVRWDVLAARAGHLMTRTPDYPPRYFVSEFPEVLFAELENESAPT